MPIPSLDAGGDRAMRRILEAGALFFGLVGMVVPYGMAPLFAVLALAVAGATVWRAAIGRPLGIRLDPALAGVLAALVVWGAASAAWSLTPRTSLVTALRLAGFMVGGTMIFGWLHEAGRGPRLRVALATGFGLGLMLAAFEIATGGAMYRAIHGLAVLPPDTPILDRPGSIYAILAWPVAMFLTTRRGGWFPGLGVAAALVPAAAFIAVAANNATRLAFLGGLLAAAAARRWPRAVAAGIAGGLVVAVALAPFADRLLPEPTALYAAPAGTLPKAESSLEHRWLIWRFTAARIREHPALGWGLDTARVIPGGHRVLRDDINYLPLHPHNGFLQLWLELGVGGAALGVALVFLVLRACVRIDDPGRRALALGQLTSALGIAGASYGVWQSWWLATLWLGAAASAAATRRRRLGAGRR